MFGYEIVCSKELHRLFMAAGKLSAKTNALRFAIDRASHQQESHGGHAMAADLQPVIDELTATETVIDSAIVFINAVPGLIAAAVTDALARGATAEQLLPVTTLADEVKAKSDILKSGLAANTPPAPPTP